MSRVPEYDGLRAVAAALVVLVHLQISPVFAFGFVGVDVFFALSGFLITASLAADPRLTKFYEKRLVRLYPALFLATLIGIAGRSVLFAQGTAWSEILQAATFTTNLPTYLDGASDFVYRYPHGLGHTWSLAVEEHFYLVWPALWLFFRRHRNAELWVKALAATSFAVLLFEVWAGPRFPTLDATSLAYVHSETRFWELLAGAILWLRLSRSESVFRPRWLALASMTMLAAGVWVAVDPNLFANNVLAEAASVALTYQIIAAIQQQRLPLLRQLLIMRPLREVGRRSYGVYLLHYPAYFLLRELPWTHASYFFVAVIVATLAGAWLSFAIVERPLLQQMRRRQRDSAPASSGRV